MTRREEIAETRIAEALGRPVKRCLSCGQIGAHWLPARLDADGSVIPGRFTCEPETEPEVALW